MVKTSELKLREIVSITDGKRLGLIKDLELDLEQGRIEAIIVPVLVNFLAVWER